VKSKHKVADVLLDRKTHALIKSMRNPPLILTKVVGTAILLSGARVRRRIDWKVSQKFLMSNALSEIDVRTVTKSTAKRAKTVMKKYGVTEKKCKYAGGPLGIALFHYVSGFLKLWDEMGDDHNLDHVKEEMHAFRRKVKKQIRNEEEKQSKHEIELRTLKELNSNLKRNLTLVTSFQRRLSCV